MSNLAWVCDLRGESGVSRTCVRCVDGEELCLGGEGGKKNELEYGT